MSGQALAELRDIELSFGDKKVLDGFSLILSEGQKLALVGESSSGKSMVLKVMVGLARPDRGQVRLFGRDLERLSGRELRAARQRIGMQFQSGALFDSYSVLENLKLARYESARTPQARASASDDRAPMKLLAEVGLSKAADRPPYALSGGMRKRAALARAITTDPDLVIFDEPTAGLDPVTSRRIINLIETLSAESGAAMILATTDVEVARRFAPELLVLNQGRLWARGSMEDLRKKPDAFIQKLLNRLL